jgi:hypothetical protein
MNDRIKKKKDPVAFKKRGIEIERRKREKKWIKAWSNATISISDLSESFCRFSKVVDETNIHLKDAIDALRDCYAIINKIGDA